MGSDIKDKTLFLEFYGLPGCGKSTVSHALSNELRKQGKTVIEPTYDIDHKYSKSVRRIIKLSKLVRYSLLYPQKYIALCTLIRKNGYKGAGLLSQTVNITSKLWAYDHAKSDYVIFDEGLTQSAISLEIFNGNSLRNEFNLFRLCKKRKTIKFYIKVSPEIALIRMKKRNKHDSRIEKIIDKDERERALRAIEMQCNTILNGFVIEGTNQLSLNNYLMQIINKEMLD